jgi:restriction endonuclease S subunit
MSKSVNQANINGSLLKQYKIPVPSLEEQNAIVAKLEKIEQQIEDAQKILDSAFAKKQAILDKYLQ